MSNADELDDGLVYDFEKNEENHDEVQLENGELEDDLKNNVSTNEDESDETTDTKKRSAVEDEEEEQKTLSKRQKKLQKNSKLRNKKKDQIQYEINKKKSIPRESTDNIAEYFATLIRGKNPDLSALELDDLYLKKSDFLSTEKFNDQVRSLDNFDNFIQQYSKAPRAIIFSMSNMRVADVSRALGGGKSTVKLFAKNKLKEDLATLDNIFSKNSGDKSQKKNKNNSNTKNIKYFIATPTRMEKILESSDVFFEGKDKLDIILDASFLDNKDNSVIAFENTQILCKVLKTILSKKSSVKILLY